MSSQLGGPNGAENGQVQNKILRAAAAHHDVASDVAGCTFRAVFLPRRYSIWVRVFSRFETKRWL